MEGGGSGTVVARINVDYIYPANQDAQPEEKAWVKNGVLTITEAHIRLSSGIAGSEMPIRGLADVEERAVGARQVLFLTRYDDRKFTSCALSSTPKTIDSLKRYFVQFITDPFRADIYFISPISRDGVAVADPHWERGILLATPKAIWFTSQEQQVRIGLSGIARVRRENRKLSGEEHEVLTIDHADGGAAGSSLILCPDSTIDVLEKYISDLIQHYNSQGDEKGLTETESQAAMLIYSGLDSGTIQAMLGIEPAALEQFYDKLLELGMAKVVRVRRELELTPRGARFVNDLMANAIVKK